MVFFLGGHAGVTQSDSFISIPFHTELNPNQYFYPNIFFGYFLYINRYTAHFYNHSQYIRLFIPVSKILHLYFIHYGNAYPSFKCIAYKYIHTCTTYNLSKHFFFFRIHIKILIVTL